MIGLCQCVRFDSELTIDDRKRYQAVVSRIIAGILPLCGIISVVSSSTCFNSENGKDGCNEH